MREVVLYDNQAITRVGIEALLEGMKEVSSISYADSKSGLVKSLIQQPGSIVITDYTLSDFASADELLNTGYRFPASHWILFSDELSSDFLRRLLFSSESFSVILKGCELDEITVGLSHILKGERFICGRVTNQMFQNQKPAADTLDHILTATEKEILKEIALGRTTKEIAAARNLSFHTIISHRKNIFRKLEVNNVHEATKYAMRAGLIDLAEYYI